VVPFQEPRLIIIALSSGSYNDEIPPPYPRNADNNEQNIPDMGVGQYRRDAVRRTRQTQPCLQGETTRRRVRRRLTKCRDMSIVAARDDTAPKCWDPYRSGAPVRSARRTRYEVSPSLRACGNPSAEGRPATSPPDSRAPLDSVGRHGANRRIPNGNDMGQWAMGEPTLSCAVPEDKRTTEGIPGPVGDRAQPFAVPLPTESLPCLRRLVFMRRARGHEAAREVAPSSVFETLCGP
jgi:hypothetical protein